MSACIVIWEDMELEYVAPRAMVPAYEAALQRWRENWPRMLQPTRPCSPLGLDDLQEWAFEENGELF